MRLGLHVMRLGLHVMISRVCFHSNTIIFFSSMALTRWWVSCNIDLSIYDTRWQLDKSSKYVLSMLVSYCLPCHFTAASNQALVYWFDQKQKCELYVVVEYKYMHILEVETIGNFISILLIVRTAIGYNY